MATKEISEQAWASVRAAEDYRAFLKLYLDVRGQKLSDLARAAGFGRGFPGDVIAGKRRLTPKSYQAFEKALKVPPAGKRLFKLLVARDEEDVFPGVDRARISAEIEAAREKSWGPAHRRASGNEAPSLRQVFRDPAAFAVYAASGKPGTGATIEEMQSRTQLGSAQVERALKGLLTAGLLVPTEEANRFEPKDLHLFFKAEDSAGLLVDFFQRSALAASRKVNDSVKSDREMFFTSSFCVNEADLPALKIALRETVLKFVDGAIQSEGDRLVNLVTSLYL